MKKIIFCLVFLAVCFVAIRPDFIFAAEASYLEQALKNEARPVGADADKPFNIYAVIFKVLFSLAVVIALMVGLAFLLKKYVPYGGIKNKGDLVRVVDITYLTPKKMIYIIDVAGEVLVLGSDSNSINFLTKIDDPEIKKNILANIKPKQINNYFSGILGKFIKEEPGKNGSNKNNIKQNINYLQAQIRKLKGIKGDPQ